jgi:8-oxo-dGTP pyrophosphatase MutT (NUDIX family)
VALTVYKYKYTGPLRQLQYGRKSKQPENPNHHHNAMRILFIFGVCFCGIPSVIGIHGWMRKKVHYRHSSHVSCPPTRIAWESLRGGDDREHSNRNYDIPQHSRQSHHLLLDTTNNDHRQTHHHAHSGCKTHFTLLKEERLFHSWRTITRRTVQLLHETWPATPISKESLSNNNSTAVLDFEVVGQRGIDAAVLIFVWHRSTRTATLIREYMPSTHDFRLGLCAGMVELDKDHDNNTHTLENVTSASSTSTDSSSASIPSPAQWERAARRELAEEGRLYGGTWMAVGVPTVVDKYMTTRMQIYLVVDPVPLVSDAPPRDDSEVGMHTVELTVPELYEALHHGHMTVVGGWAMQLALHQLRGMGEIE